MTQTRDTPTRSPSLNRRTKSCLRAPPPVAKLPGDGPTNTRAVAMGAAAEDTRPASVAKKHGVRPSATELVELGIPAEIDMLIDSVTQSRTKSAKSS